MLITEIKAPRANKITKLLIRSIFVTNETPIQAAKKEHPLVIMDTEDFYIAI